SGGRLAIVGTGLIGTSVGLAAKHAGGFEVSGWDLDAEALAGAVERGAVDRPAATLGEAVADAELAVVAAPVAQLAGVVGAVLTASGSGCIVTDVGSTKSVVVAVNGGSPRFIGGHPVAGSEAQGPAHARAELFEGA